MARTIYQVLNIWTEVNGTADNATLTVADDSANAILVEVASLTGQTIKFDRAALQAALNELAALEPIPA